MYNLTINSKTEELRGEEKKVEVISEIKEKEKTPKQIDYSEYAGLTKPGTKYLADELVKQYREGTVVYCKYGAKYIEKIEK